MLFVERSNRTERLLEGLAGRLSAPTPDPLAPSIVVVQGPGMERWLAQRVAQRYGICANTEFLFPRQLLDRIFAVLPGSNLALEGSSHGLEGSSHGLEGSSYGREGSSHGREGSSHGLEGSDPALDGSAWEVGPLTWAIARLLEEGRGDPDFAPLARHLEAPDGAWRLVQLARQIAVLLDRYVTFRPEWIRDWSAASELPSERDERWQARLVRDLRARLGPGHFADRAAAFLAAVSKDPEAIRAALSAGSRGFRGRIEIFAVSTLPPLYLSLLDGLAQVVDVHLSILSPSESYWADLWREVRDGELASEEGGPGAEGRAAGLFDAAPATPAARLLAGLGRLGGDFQRCLEESMSGGQEELEDYTSPVEEGASPSLLTRLQADLLELDPGAPEPGPDRVVSPGDDSIQLHFCHGPRRELEVVEAALRAAFEADPTLAPEDVIVMAPRIDEIAPDIEAVFGVPRDEGQRIPYQIADRGALKRSPVAETFRSLLDLLGGRAARSEVLDWLTQAPARERFGLDEEAVERLAEWAERAGIRFGLDEVHREELGLARERRHTWAAGLERLALAHAVGATAETFEGTAPEPLDAFSDPSVLGAVGELEAMLREARALVGTPRSVAGWCRLLEELLERSCHQSDSNAHEHTDIRKLLQELSAAASTAGFEATIPFEAIREQVSDALASSPAPQAFLAGGVTFCELVPLRAIPFKVIAILGLSDSAFPRGRPSAGFDLMARAPKPGDRSTRDDDRYLFLEALLSARERLILSVPGRDVRDGSDLPPSIVVAELLDAIEGSFWLEGSSCLEGSTPLESGGPGGLRERLVVKHPLQSFSPRYFETPGDDRMRGRDEEAFDGAQARRRAIGAGGGETRRFLAGLGEADPSTSKEASKKGASEAEKRLSLDELVARVLRSTRNFTRERLRLRLPRMDEVVGDLDPFTLAPLDRFALGAALLDDLAAGTTTEIATARLLSRAAVPSGVPGQLAARALREEVEEIARLGRARCSGSPDPDVEVEVSLEVDGLGTCVLGGRIDRVWPEGRIQVAFGRLDSRGEYDVWIRHLFLCAAVADGLDRPPRSVLVGRPKEPKSTEHVVAFDDVADARAHLARLFEWAWSTTEAPLPFFPKTSRVFAEPAIEGKRDQAWRAAHHRFHGGESGNFRIPESEEELEYARLWEGLSPLDAEADDYLHFRFDEVAETFFRPLLEARRVESG